MLYSFENNLIQKILLAAKFWMSSFFFSIQLGTSLGTTNPPNLQSRVPFHGGELIKIKIK